MPAKTEKAKVLHYLEACFKVLTTTNGQVANLIDGNVQLNVLYPIPDNFQGVAEMVLDSLQNHQESTLLQKSYKFFGRKQRGSSKILLI